MKLLSSSAPYRILQEIKCTTTFIKKLDGSQIWEFRTLYNRMAYRLFAFWDTQENRMVVATHGIIKKTKKTPKKEIAKAESIRIEYFKNK